MTNWVKCSDRLPDIKDDSVLVYFPKNGGMGMVHIQDYFEDITNGLDETGKQRHTKWYLSQGVTHWMPMPEPPSDQKEEP